MALGGDEVGRGTLVVFHSLHTTVLPAMLLFGMAFHFWRVRKAGGVIPPASSLTGPDGETGTVLFVPHLLLREVAVGLVLTSLVVLLAVAAPPALGEPANPGMSPNPAKAPWYFAALQELLMHLHPSVAVLLVPLAVLGPGPATTVPSKRWPSSGRPLPLGTGPRGRLHGRCVWRRSGPGLGAPRRSREGMDRLGSRSSRRPDGDPPLLPQTPAATRRRPGTRHSRRSSPVVFAGVVVFTLTTVFFRGRGMELVLPWNR